MDDSVDREELTSPDPVGVGTTVRTTLRSMGREYVYTWEIVEHQPPSRMTIESTSSPFPTTLTYQLSEREGMTALENVGIGPPYRDASPIRTADRPQHAHEPRPRLCTSQAAAGNQPHDLNDFGLADSRSAR
jgi:hypothetical protein